MAHAYPQGMLQNTLQALSRADAAPATGADLIKDWISTLKSTDGADALTAQLRDLYDELLNPSPDAARVKQSLNIIAGHTQSLARDLEPSVADELTKLAESLRSFATELNRVSNDDELAENQVDTATIYDLPNPGDRAQLMLNDTLAVFSGGAAATTPEAGFTLVEDWITVVRSDVSTQWMEASLGQLRDALEANDMRTTERLMRELASQTQDLANNTAEGQFKSGLSNLATALINFAGPLS
jgi:hypothetical protein